MAKTIAIVEDEPAIRDNYAELFRRQGFRVETFATRAAADSSMQRALPDLAILDIALDEDYDAGFELCRTLRHRAPTLPIIFLTARDAEIDIVAGLRVGADDYVSKSVSLHQLSARVSALLRRVEAAHQDREAEPAIEAGELLLQPERMLVQWRGHKVELTVTELWILHALVAHPGHVKSREQLMDAADSYVDLATITSHIKRIRRKFLQIDADFDAIEAVYGAGYRWRSPG